MKIIVNAHKCEIDKTPVNEKEINITKCEFEFAEEITSDFVKEAYFTLGKGETYKQIIVDNECDIPGEVLEKKGDVTIGVVAYLVENNTTIKRYNPSPAYFNTWEGSLRNAENSQPITPSEMEQYEQALQDGLSEVNQKLVDIDEAIEDVNEAITETNNLNLDVSKSGKVATVTLTKKDASKKVVTLSDGTSLMFNWDGTKLGIKTDEDAEYTYVDLQGIQGVPGPKGDAFQIKKTYTSVAEMNADFNNMQLGDYVMIATTVEVEDNAKLYTRGEEQWIFISDFSGATGIRGETGLTPNIQIGTVVSGETPNVTRTGTNENPILNFTLVKGDKGDVGSTGPTGATGNGIASINKTSSEGLVDTYTITYTDGTTSTFQITNGEDGETPLSEFNALKEDVEDLRDNQITLPAEGTNIHVEDAAKARLYEFGLNKESTQDNIAYVDVGEWEQGTINSNGENQESSKAVRTKDYIKVHPNVLYNISRSIYNSYMGFRFYDINNNYLGNHGTTGMVETNRPENRMVANDSNMTMTILNSNVAYLRMFYNSNNLSTIYTISTEDTPSPDYPQEVKTVKGYSNLFDKDSSNYFNTYIGSVSHAISTVESEEYRTIYIPIEGGKKYTITKKYGGSLALGTSIELPYKGLALNDYAAPSNKLKYTINTSSSANYLIVYIYSNIDYENNLPVDDVMNTLLITEGTEEKPYVPYGNNYIAVNVSDGTNTNSIPLPLNENEIAGIGNYLDEYIVDKSGHCWLNKLVDKVVLDGSEEGWFVDNSETANYSYRLRLPGNVIAQMGLSNNFIRTNITNSNTSEGFDIRNATTNKEIRIRYGIEETIENFKEWLSTHNTTVYYVLNQATNEPITDTTLINQLDLLEKAYAYQNQTNISQSNNEKPFVIDAETVRDLSNIFDI